MMDLKPIKKVNMELNELIEKEHKHSIEYKVKYGECFGWGLFKDKEIAVQRSFLTKNSYFKTHVHPKEIEILIIYKGKAKIIIDKKTKILDVGEVLKIEKGVPHSWKTLEDTWMIGITIPASEDYPNAP